MDIENEALTIIENTIITDLIKEKISDISICGFLFLYFPYNFIDRVFRSHFREYTANSH